jgi:hypothetical protein
MPCQATDPTACFTLITWSDSHHWDIDSPDDSFHRTPQVGALDARPAMRSQHHEIDIGLVDVFTNALVQTTEPDRLGRGERCPVSIDPLSKCRTSPGAAYALCIQHGLRELSPSEGFDKTK